MWVCVKACGSITLPRVLESRREVPVARAAVGESREGLTSFAPGLCHAYEQRGGKRKKECFSPGQIKTKLLMRGKQINNREKQ